MSLQSDCPTCAAPMWDRCPWDNGAGCMGLSLRVNVALRKRPKTERPAKVTSESTPRLRRPAQPRAPRLTPEEARRRKVARSAAYNAAHRAPRPLGDCAYCHKRFATRFPSRRRYCSDRCRGRLDREMKAAA